VHVSISPQAQDSIKPFSTTNKTDTQKKPVLAMFTLGGLSYKYFWLITMLICNASLSCTELCICQCLS